MLLASRLPHALDAAADGPFSAAAVAATSFFVLVLGIDGNGKAPTTEMRGMCRFNGSSIRWQKAI
jgi:hypothetical protein